MILLALLLIPILGIFIILTDMFNVKSNVNQTYSEIILLNRKRIKFTALTVSIVNLFVSLILFIFFDFSSNQFQFVQEYHEISHFHIYLGVDGLSIYFVLLTTIITPISLLSNWTSISENIKSYVIIILLLETLLLAVFLVLDILLFYIFFESILPPLFLLIGLFGSSNKVRASFYLFLYTLILQCKRAKHRENPKALVTKVIKEILLPAWLMIQGMVKSLEMKKVNFLKWTTAVLSHPLNKKITSKLFDNLNINKYWNIFFITYKGVKEQRVDGSSKPRNLGFVRCTLIAGKPVFGRTIQTHSNNKTNFMRTIYSKSFHSNNKNKGIYHPSNSLANPWFVTGLMDAEGCFMLFLRKSNEYKMGYQVQAIFKIALHKKDYNLLQIIQNFFGVGKITKHGDTTLQYTVKSLSDLQIIISHFDKYPLASEKWGDYKLFKQGIELMKVKAHLNKEGFNKILSIKASLNLGFNDDLNLVFPDIKAVKRPQVSNKNGLDYNWIAGLASGDGCFYVSIRNSPTTKSGKSVTLKFHIVQHSRDIELMKLLVFSLKCGRIELALNQSAVYFVISDFKDIFEKLIPLFDKYNIKGIKALDYLDFKKVAMLINDKKHMSDEGISEIKSIKSNMNLGRNKF